MKKYTPVLLEKLPMGTKFEQHPFFHNIPYVSFRHNVEERWLNELRELEGEVHSLLMGRKAESHRYGANEGFNLGLSVVAGYPHGNRAKNISGSVQWAEVVKGRPELRAKILNCLV